jgi:hypothetical protein
MTLSIKGLYLTLSKSDTQHKQHSVFRMLCHYAECRAIFIILLNVYMPDVVMLSVIMLCVMAPIKQPSLLFMYVRYIFVYLYVA